MFSYLIINFQGIPLFQYPSTSEISGVKINSVLFSSLISALNSFSLEATGNVLGEVNFGSVVTTVSKDEYNNIHVLLTEETIPVRVNKQIHIELKSLFIGTIKEMGYNLNLQELPEGNLLEKAVYPILDPFKRLWEKRLRNNEF